MNRRDFFRGVAGVAVAAVVPAPELRHVLLPAPVLPVPDPIIMVTGRQIWHFQDATVRWEEMC